jgi:hypothetical protein
MHMSDPLYYGYPGLVPDEATRPSLSTLWRGRAVVGAIEAWHHSFSTGLAAFPTLLSALVVG